MRWQNSTGQRGPILEKNERGNWVVAWAANVPPCLSSPIEIQPGETYIDTLGVFAGHPGNDYYPKFDVQQPEGSYRLLWLRPVHNYDLGAYDSGDLLPLEYRISNEFGLRRE